MTKGRQIKFLARKQFLTTKAVLQWNVQVYGCSKGMVSKFPFKGRIEAGTVIPSVWVVMGGFCGGREVRPGVLRSFP